MKSGNITEHKKKNRNVYFVLISIVLILIVILSVVVFKLPNLGQNYDDQNNFGPGPIEIEVTTDKLSYLQGELINFTIYVNNPHNWPVPLPITVSYKIRGNGDLVFDGGASFTPPPGPVETYPAHSRTFSSTYTWNQKTDIDGNLTLVPPGNYNLTVTFYGTVDYGEGGNCLFKIRQ